MGFRGPEVFVTSTYVVQLKIGVVMFSDVAVAPPMDRYIPFILHACLGAFGSPCARSFSLAW
jgi:hypothetical protein